MYQQHSGIHITKKPPKFSAVRLKHNDRIQNDSAGMPRAVTHSVSHGAGVLLGNMNTTHAFNETIQTNPQPTRELNNSTASGNIKSVYDMRVSSNMGTNAAGRPPKQIKVNKAKRMQSAITRGNKPPQNLSLQQNNATFSHHNINDNVIKKHKNVNILSNMSSSNNQPVRLSQTIQDHVTSASINPPNVHSTRPGGVQRLSNNLDNMDLQVKGNSSIRTLIRLANIR